MFNQIPGHPLIQLGWHIKPHFSLHVARMHSEDWASVCVSQSEFLRKHLPSGALFPSIPHITLEQRTRPRMWMAQGHRLRVSGRTRTETLCPDFQPQLTHATPENLPFLSTVRRVAMFVCLLGHLRLDLRMSWCSAFNLFLLLPLAIKVLLISHSLIYISYLLFLRLTQCSQSGVLQAHPVHSLLSHHSFTWNVPLYKLWLSISACLENTASVCRNSFLKCPSLEKLLRPCE